MEAFLLLGFFQSVSNRKKFKHYKCCGIVFNVCKIAMQKNSSIGMFLFSSCNSMCHVAFRTFCYHNGKDQGLTQGLVFHVFFLGWGGISTYILRLQACQKRKLCFLLSLYSLYVCVLLSLYSLYVCVLLSLYRAYMYSGENKYLNPCRFRKFGHLQRNVWSIIVMVGVF